MRKLPPLSVVAWKPSGSVTTLTPATGVLAALSSMIFPVKFPVEK